ncbi:MAG: alkaline phosphatase [Haloarculaceae archaeon]
MTDDEPTTDRRSVLGTAGGFTLAGALADALGAVPSARALDAERLSDDLAGLTGAPTPAPDADPDADRVFPQGVAAGDPTPSGAMLWTRVAPEAYAPGRKLTLQVVAESGFDRLGAIWSIETDGLPARDHAVKVDLDGHLDADRAYRYRFVFDGVAGPIGRFRTLPAPESSPDAVRLGVLTCQDYRNGYYGAYRHLAREDLDYLLHLGDFIYEWGGPSDHDGRAISLPSGRAIAWGLEDFRHLYKLTCADPHLQDALASAALIATWDDHEIVDDRFYDYEEGRPYAGPGAHPRNDDAAFMTQLFADGIRAWWEHMPVRVRYDPDADSLLDQLGLWRSFRFGDLLKLVVTDERLFRSRHDGDVTPQVSDAAVASPGAAALDHTILGAEQRGWFVDRVADDATTWTTWANEVLNMWLADEYGGEQYFDDSDAWDGYETERRLLMRALADRGVENFVALSGDLHTALAGYLQVEYGQRAPPDDRVGVELMTPAVSSQNLAEQSDLLDSPLVRQYVTATILRKNPHLEFFDSYNHGYAVAEFTPDACEFTVYAVDKNVPAAEAPRRRLAAFRVPEGTPELRSL